MEKRILAVLIAAMAGGAYAQTYVTSGASGNVVTNGYGQCWQSGAAGSGTLPCPSTSAAGQTAIAPANRMQLAQNNRNTAPAQRATAPQPAGATATASNPPPSRGYIGSGAGVVATNPYGLCWRSGADWSADKAAAPCDAVPRASVPPAPIAQAPAPEPVPAPIAAAAPAPAPVVIEKITLSTDVLFAFNKAERWSEDVSEDIVHELLDKDL